MGPQQQPEISAHSSFFHAFWPELAAALLAGLIILGLGYWLIDNRLRLRERAQSEARTRHAVLQIVYPLGSSALERGYSARASPVVGARPLLAGRDERTVRARQSAILALRG